MFVYNVQSYSLSFTQAQRLMLTLSSCAQLTSITMLRGK